VDGCAEEACQAMPGVVCLGTDISLQSIGEVVVYFAARNSSKT
jgi:hypothetical protein